MSQTKTSPLRIMNVFFRLCLVPGKFEEKWKGKKIEKKSKRKEKVKEKKRFKFNKLFLYISSNSFYLFLSLIARLTRKSFSLTFFFFP